MYIQLHLVPKVSEPPAYLQNITIRLNVVSFSASDMRISSTSDHRLCKNCLLEFMSFDGLIVTYCADVPSFVSATEPTLYNGSIVHRVPIPLPKPRVGSPG